MKYALGIMLCFDEVSSLVSVDPRDLYICIVQGCIDRTWSPFY